MQSSESSLLVLAEAVADGTDVDWERAESSAQDPEERRIIQQLRHLAGVSTAARTHALSWGSLELRGELGKGTFGTVYRAWDTRLEREVALKLLNDDAAVPFASTVIKEGRLLARVRHPNIVTVFGADVDDGRVGIWMELVSGRTLKDVVVEQGPFGAHEAAIIGRDVCRALAAVHQRGYLHRDVKAQNVMREAGGRTVLMDFGAGESVPREGEPAAILRGSPAYLAPELLRGESPSVQSDIYSAGVLLYFLVSGEFPVTGRTLDELRERHAQGHRKLLRDARPDLPAAFVRAVDSATASDPADRPSSAGALEALLERALVRPEDGGEPESQAPRPSQSAQPGLRLSERRAVILAAVLVIVATIGWGAWDAYTSRAAAVTPRDSVAILPFRALDQDADEQDEIFSEGITSDLVANLTSLRDLRVISGGSVLQLKARGKTSVEIAKELGVATVLDATVRRSDDRVRIVAHLIDANSGETLWSESFDSRMADIIAMKSDVAHKIAVALRGELSQRETDRLLSSKRYDYEALELYFKGRHYWNIGTEEAVNRSIRYFLDAIARDKQFAPAHAGLADAFTRLGVQGAIPRQDAFARAAKAAETAVALDDTLAEAHASLGYAQTNRFEWQEAEKSFKRALELKPGYATAHHWYSILLTQQRRLPEAITEIKIALSLDPLSLGSNLQLAAVLVMARRYDDAIAQYERALPMDADYATTFRHKAMTYAHKGDYEGALTLLREAVQKTPLGAEDQELKADMGYVLAAGGRAAEGLEIAADLVERHRRTGEEVAGSIAAIFAGAGRIDDAFVWLTKARDTRDPEVGYLKVDPRWDNLRGDPRFNAILASLRLAD